MDMEDTRCTQLELDMFHRLRRHHANVGVVLQSYLKRTDEDLGPLLERGANLRLCKGIYAEAREHLVDGAWRDRRAINAHMVRHFARSLDAGVYVALATHDEEVIDQAIAIAEAKGASRFEFQMLLGVCEPLRDRLLQAGHRVRIYVPYGADWHGYSVRRLKENPQIAGHLMRAFFRRR
jgi:proline dehydrogenase